ELADAWLWLGWTADSPEQAIGYLNAALERDPSNRLARKFLDVATEMNQFELLVPPDTVAPTVPPPLIAQQQTDKDDDLVELFAQPALLADEANDRAGATAVEEVE